MSTARDHNRIDLIVSGRREEARAAAVMSPGHCLELDSSGTLILQATAGGRPEGSSPCLVASIDHLQGKTVDDAFAIGDLVQYIIPKPGDVLAILLKAEQDITINDLLTFSGDGTLSVAESSDEAVYQALETMDLTGGEDTLIKARKL